MASLFAQPARAAVFAEDFMVFPARKQAEINQRLTIIAFIRYTKYTDLIPNAVAQFAMNVTPHDCRDA